MKRDLFQFLDNWRSNFDIWHGLQIDLVRQALCIPVVYQIEFLGVNPVYVAEKLTSLLVQMCNGSFSRLENLHLFTRIADRLWR